MERREAVPEDPPGDPPSVLWVALLALLVVAGVVAVVPEPGGTPARSTAGSAAPGVDTGGAVDAFLAAYERSRTATYVLVQTSTRTNGAAELSYTVRLVQRPPTDRFTVGGGVAQGIKDGRVVRCAADLSGAATCFDGPEADDAERAAGDIADARRAVSGDAPLYSVVRRADGCFTLTLRRDLPAPPWGLQWTVCFDEATGAPIRQVTQRTVDVVETTIAEDVRSEVVASDLEIGDVGALPEPDATS